MMKCVRVWRIVAFVSLLDGCTWQLPAMHSLLWLPSNMQWLVDLDVCSGRRGCNVFPIVQSTLLSTSSTCSLAHEAPFKVQVASG